MAAGHPYDNTTGGAMPRAGTLVWLLDCLDTAEPAARQLPPLLQLFFAELRDGLQQLSEAERWRGGKGP